jgi:hypothetical protein
VFNGETAGVFEGSAPDAETAGVLGDETAGVFEGNEPNKETAGVLENEEPEITEVEESDGETTEMFGNNDAPSNDEGNTSELGSNTSDSDDDEIHGEIADEDVYHPDTMTSSVQRTYGLKPRKPRDYSHRHAMVVHNAMTQYSVKSGLRNFKEK